MPEAYFPPLDKCLSGEVRLLSWKTVHSTLCDPFRAVEETALESFLIDEESTACLIHSLKPFPAPSSKSKSDYATKTAPINVSESKSSDYNLDELKSDAQWLSEKLKIEELAALRIVVLEWQSRAEDYLRQRFNTGTNSQSLESSITLTNAADATTRSGPTERVRRRRLLGLFLEERSYLLRTTAGLIGYACFGQSYSTLGSTWLGTLATNVKQQTAGEDARLELYVDAARALIDLLDHISNWPEPFKPDANGTDQGLDLLFAKAKMQDIASIFEILLFSISALKDIPSSTLVTSWFGLMSHLNFFQDLVTSTPITTTLQCLISSISLAILRLRMTMTAAQQLLTSAEEAALYPSLSSGSYLYDEACIKEVNLVLYHAAEQEIFVAAPALYAWSIITSLIRDGAKWQETLRIEDGSEDGEPRSRRASRRDSKEGLTVLEKLYLLLQNPEFEPEARDDPPAFFARMSVDGMGVFPVISQLCTTLVEIYGSPWDQAVSLAVRISLLDLVQDGFPMVTYGAPVLESILTLLRPEVPGRATSSDWMLADMALGEGFASTVADQALSRYPYELTPVLRLFTAMSSVSGRQRVEGLPRTVRVLDNLSTMTVMVPDNFRAYELENEDENVNSMRLTGALPLFMSRSALSLYDATSAGPRQRSNSVLGTEQKKLLSIPSATTGVFLKETRPYVFCLKHAHSGLGYLGLLLSTLLPDADVLIPPMYTELNRATAADIVSLITALLTSCKSQDDDIEGAQYVLDRLSMTLQDEKDIVSAIADTMEVELQAHLEQSVHQGSLDLLVACAEFFDELIQVNPERVWSVLTSSSLLGLNGGVAALATVVGSIEVPTGRFRFLAACVSMYSHLITDAITGLVRRKMRPAKFSNRFTPQTSPPNTTPDRTMSNVLTAFQAVMLDVWQSLPEWRFALPVELSKITIMVLDSFSKLLRAAYGIGSARTAIASLLMPAANRLLDGCAPATTNGTTARPFSIVLKATLAVEDEDLPSIERSHLIEQGISTLQFLTVLLRTANTIDGSSSRASVFASQLVESMPIFSSLLVASHSFKAPVYSVLNEMMQTAQGSLDEPPSILAQLDSASAKSFLSVISHLDRPLCEIGVEVTIWNMLSAVMNSKQQWFALYLLTGTVPKDRNKDNIGQNSQPRSKSLLAYALEQLSYISHLPPERAIAMLKFIFNAQNAWIWATNEIRSHPEFLKNCTEWLNNLRVPTRAANIAEELLSTNEHEMAAELCSLLAVNLHAANEVGDKSLIKLLPSKLGFLTAHGVAVNAYKRSLHFNLRDNFAKKFPSCELADFKRTPANPAPFGRNYYYDLDIADQVLKHEAAWDRSSNGRNQGFSDEFARANANLSLVEAQRRLLRSWQVLSTTLSECAAQDEVLQEELAKVVATCLRTNAETDLEQPGMDEVVGIRAETAFIILSRLVSIKSTVSTMKKILLAAWDVVLSSPMNYDVATSVEDAFYYRKLLQILYLAMQPHAYKRPRASRREPKATDETSIEFVDPAVAACVVQMMEKLIAPGFRALCGNLHDSTIFAEPGDFALVTGLLQAALSIPGILAVHQQLADIVSNTGIVRGALSLYSWSDRLAETMQQDPIYGEAAITFVLSLSVIAQVAEQMALDGSLLQLSSANLSNYFRKTGGKGPFSEPRRMFDIWTEGFLPIVLNLLDAVGPPIAAEVAAFLNSFSDQLERASTALENREATRQNPYARAITLSLVSEAQSLCLIARILKSDIARGAAAGINAGDVPDLQYDYSKVREDAAGLMRQKTSLASRIVPLGEREQSWMTGGTNLATNNVLLSKISAEISDLLKCFADDTDGS